MHEGGRVNPLSGPLQWQTRRATSQPVSDGLNDAQRLAVEHREGPLLVLAGAGSGKTRVVTMRIARLLLEGESPRSILALTFTNKAAKEMKERLIALAGKKLARGVVVSTFHSLCARLLRRDAHRIELSSAFVILDEGDQRAQLLHVARGIGLQLSEKEPRIILGKIGLWKNRGLRRHEDPLERFPSVDPVAQLTSRLWRPYQEHLRTLSAVDFDDLLLYTRELLETVPDVRRRYQALFRFLHIDEYQDTNPLQLDIVRLLCGPHKNLCVVGDDDQAIYGFRGADLDNILAFDQHYSPCTVVKLEENYRSTGHILAAANAVIQKNEQRRDKTLFTRSGDGAPIEILPVADGDAEADTVGTRIFELVFKEQVPGEDIAILYRAAPQSRLFEEGLRLRGVPYRVVGGQEFFQKKEVKDTLAYLTCLARPDEEIAFRRASNLPARGLGSKSLLRVIAGARQAQTPLVEFAAQGAPGVELKDKVRAALVDFATPLVTARPRILAGSFDENVDLAGLARTAIDQAGLRALADEEPELEARQRRLECIDEVIDAFAAFVDRLREAREAPDLDTSGVVLGEIGLEGPLAAFLDRLALDDDKDDDRDEDKPKKGKVQLMTLHASKGLEFPWVFLVGLEEGLLPHRRVIEEGGQRGIEEERRLCYVGITRARRRLVITHALARRKRHEMVGRKHSRFLDDLPNGPIRAPVEAIPDDPAADFFARMKAKLGNGGEADG